MADLMIPLIFVVIMLCIIECMESPLFLLIIAIAWMPIGIIFLGSGDYDKLFQAAITYTNSTRWLMGGVMSSVSIAASMRMIYIRRQLGSEAVKES